MGEARYTLGPAEANLASDDIPARWGSRGTLGTPVRTSPSFRSTSRTPDEVALTEAGGLDLGKRSGEAGLGEGRSMQSPGVAEPDSGIPSEVD